MCISVPREELAVLEVCPCAVVRVYVGGWVCNVFAIEREKEREREREREERDRERDRERETERERERE